MTSSVYFLVPLLFTITTFVNWQKLTVFLMPSFQFLTSSCLKVLVKQIMQLLVQNVQRLIPAIPSINQLQFQALNSQFSAPVWQQQGADVWRVSHYQVLISRPPSDSHKKDNQAVASSRNHTMMMHCSTSLFSSLLDQFKYPNKRVC